MHQTCDSNVTHAISHVTYYSTTFHWKSTTLHFLLLWNLSHQKWGFLYCCLLMVDVFPLHWRNCLWACVFLAHITHVSTHGMLFTLQGNNWLSLPVHGKRMIEVERNVILRKAAQPICPLMVNICHMSQSQSNVIYNLFYFFVLPYQLSRCMYYWSSYTEWLVFNSCIFFIS